MLNEDPLHVQININKRYSACVYYTTRYIYYTRDEAQMLKQCFDETLIKEPSRREYSGIGENI